MVVIPKKDFLLECLNEEYKNIYNKKIAEIEFQKSLNKNKKRMKKIATKVLTAVLMDNRKSKRKKSIKQ